MQYSGPKSLILYLKSRIVYHYGEINERELSAADKKSLQDWVDQGIIERTKLKLPVRAKKVIDPNATNATHKIRFSEPAWDLAAMVERELADQFVTTVQPGKEKKKHQKNQVKLDPLEFIALCEKEGNAMTVPQQLAAEGIFQVFNKPELRFFLTNPQTGISFLLQGIDQYIHIKKHLTHKP